MAGRSFLNELQELLQLGRPGVPSQDLLFIESEPAGSSAAGFRSRARIPKASMDAAGLARSSPEAECVCDWSKWCPNKRASRQEAARIALQLIESKLASQNSQNSGQNSHFQVAAKRESNRSWVNEFQEFLQAKTPQLGFLPHELWQCEFRNGMANAIGGSTFEARIVLLNRGTNEGNWAYDWSRAFATKKEARQEAARLALGRLKSAHETTIEEAMRGNSAQSRAGLAFGSNASASASASAFVLSGYRSSPGGVPRSPAAAPASPFGTNWLNKMQEHLQAHAPGLGCRPDEMWRPESRQASAGDGFEARIVLINTRNGTDEQCPWSSAFPNLKMARQDAARLAYNQLVARAAAVHDSTAVSVRVHEKTASNSRGGVPQPLGPVRVLPGSAHELIPEAVFMSKLDDLQAEPSTPLRHSSHTVSEYGLALSPVGNREQSLYAQARHLRTLPRDLDMDIDDKRNTGDMVDDEANTRLGFSRTPSLALAPPNLGALGEQYAYQWLRRQPWATNVAWVNEVGEIQNDHDIEIQPLDSRGRRHVEVKTRWKGFGRAAASKRQLARLNDPNDSYMLLVVGDFRNLYLDPLQAPKIRIWLSTNPPPS